MDFPRKVWNAWVKIGHVIGDFIGRLLLSILYFTIVAPFGLITRFFNDPMQINDTGGPEWVTRDEVEATIEEAQRLA